MSRDASPIGLMLVNFGVPADPSQAEVVKFMRAYMTDGRVAGKIGMAIYRLLHFSHYGESVQIATERFQEVAEGDDFPYNRICKHLRRKAEAQLAQLGAGNVAVAMAYRYGRRSMAKAFKHLRKLGCQHILVMPLYPQSSFGLTASVHDEYRRAKRRMSGSIEFRFVDNFFNDPGYIAAVVHRIRETLGDKDMSETKFLFAFRSSPLRDMMRGDTYELQTSATALAIAEKLGLSRKQWTIAYEPYDQVSSRAFLAPTISEAIERFVLGSVRDVVVVCPGQVTDSVDTLFEIDHRLRRIFEQGCASMGDSCSFTYVPALNDDDAFARAIAKIALANMHGWPVRGTAADDPAMGKHAQKAAKQAELAYTLPSPLNAVRRDR